MLNPSLNRKCLGKPGHAGFPKLRSNSIMRIWFRILIFGLLVSGCASSGPAIRSVPQSPPMQGMARVTIERSTDFRYLALSARVRVNGIDVGVLSRGDVASIDVQSGRTIVSVDTASSPGTFSVSFIAKPNQEYLMEVSPRSDSFLPVLFGYPGVFVDAAVNEQSGLFQLAGKGGKQFDIPSQSSTASTSQALPTSAQQAELSNEQANTPPVGGTVERLRKLKQLLDSGLINQQDYERKKEEIIKSM